MAGRDSLEETLNSFGGSDLIPHERLVQIAHRAWLALPDSERAGGRAVERWRSAIYAACKPSLDTAVASLNERNGDEPQLLGAKLVLLRDTFTRQVERAMQDLSDNDRKRRDQVRAMKEVDRMIKDMK